MIIINKLLKKITVLFICLTLLYSAYTQDRGNSSFGYPHASYASMRGLTPGTAAGGGGIMFEKAAVPKDGQTLGDMIISYDPLAIDGQRMKLDINGKNIGFKLYDWQLLPLAKYANHEYTLCFTYFGMLIDKDLENLVLDNGGHILNYHEELANTLLGWRLADMDLLVMYDFTTDLPKINNEYVLGAGEKIPNVSQNNLGFYNYLDYLYNIEDDLGYSFRSYIITDHFSETEIEIINDSLVLSGNPYYYCWRLRQDVAGFDIEGVSDSIENHYSTVLNQELQKNPGFREKELYIDSLISLSVKYRTWFPIYESGPIIDLNEYETYEAKSNYLNQYYTADLKSYLIEVASYMHAFDVIHLTEYSERMSEHPEMIAACNPAVWNATLNTMRISAFFRYIKQNFPAQWQAFYNDVKDVMPEPEVLTPTVIYDKGNVIIEQALANSPKVFLNDIAVSREIKIFPNPTTNILYVQNLAGINHLSVLDINGKTVWSDETLSENLQIPMYSLSPGNYVIRIIQNGKLVHRQKIVKE